ncbi:hypothetical protein GCM10010401_04730 [Rarobacter faecitabidus]|uniref:Uncharacterized protein n=1 Tax=Rarobacter faecitabidus TaxID=13243 RepID=A0A542ZTU4_RARFA|nr:hypothetical protein [Rarobacter faecitabidus]TQL63771.1 hypothetical protein FB461_0247 [Rarobacter faecitabidus]
MSDGPVFPPVRGGSDGGRSGGQPADDQLGSGTQATPASDASHTGPIEGAATAPVAPAGALADEPAEHLADVILGGDADGNAEDDSDAAESEAPEDASEDQDGKKRFAWWVWALIGGGALLVIAGVVIAIVSSRSGAPAPAPTVTVTADAPTPAGTPFERGTGSELFQAIPATGNQFTLTALADNAAWVDDRDAIEAYDATYTATIDGAEVTLSVTIGQWGDADEAAEAAKVVTAETVGTDTALSDVRAGDAVVGNLWAPLAGLPGDATPAGLVWTNGSTVIALTGPGDQLQRFYDGYGL